MTQRLWAWLLPIGVIRLTPNYVRVIVICAGFPARVYQTDMPWEGKHP